MSNNIKECNSCKRCLELNKFATEKRNKDGKTGYCRECERDRRENKETGPFIRNCPKCNDEIIYKSKGMMEKCENSNSLCSYCSNRNEEKFKRPCPSCGVVLSYKYSSNFSQAKTDNTFS